MKQVQVVIGGIVQGVGFRFATLQTARALKVRGWVKNLPSGEVELLAEGEEGALTELVEWCHLGPNASKVTSVQVIERPITASQFSSFEIR